MAFGKDVTLVVPTRNRPAFLNRLLTYFAAEDFGGVLAIGDSSDDAEFKDSKRILESFRPTLQIRHVPCQGMNAPQATVEVLKAVDTRFATLLPDDDFLYPPTIDKCTAFLDEHPNYSVATGRGCIFSVVGDGQFGEINNVVPYATRPLEQATASARLTDHFMHYSVTTFGIHRAQELRDAFSGAADIKIGHFAGEILPGAMHVINGKICVIDELYLIRQEHGQRLRMPATMLEWMVDPAWSATLDHFLSRLSNALCGSEQMSPDAAKHIVAQGFAHYLAVQMQKRDLLPVGSKWTRLAPIRRSVQRHAGLRKILRLARSFMPKDYGRLSLEALLRSSSPFWFAFDSVVRIVTSPQTADARPTNRCCP